MQFEKKFSGYIGFDPISLFITLDDIDYGLHGIAEWFSAIKSYYAEDLIFQGAIIRNLDFLQWLSARLIAEEYYISLVLDCKEFQTLKETRVYAHRITLMMNGLEGVKTTSLLERLGENDLIILNTEQVEILNRIVKNMKGINCQASLYFNTKLLNESKVLKAGITKAYPFGGLNASKESTNDIGTADRIGVHQEKS